jgi:uncharacterized protein YcbK (DUF882 family)
MKKKWTTAIVVFLCCLCLSQVRGESETKRRLSFYNTHTAERLSVTYKKSDTYILEAMDKISNILRDHRSGDIHPIDPKLMDFLYDLLSKVDNHSEVAHYLRIPLPCNKQKASPGEQRSGFQKPAHAGQSP